MADQLLKDLFKAYFDARRNKRNTCNALEFEINYERKIFDLYYDLKNNNYELSRSIAFIVNNPVKREVIAASFRDRVIHHLIFNYINPVFEPSFINDSYSCRKGKGTSYGIKRLQHFIRSCSDNYQKNCYILKLDLSGYFMSINRNILYKIIEDKLMKKNIKYNFDVFLVLDLIKKTIFNNCIGNCLIKGDLKDWSSLPINKSLFCAKKDCGLPIGNLTSQLFSNIYLSNFDYFVKRNLRFKHYGRYVDDFIIVDKDKEKLKKAILDINKYLKENLYLKLHPKKIYLQNFSHGVDFLGAVIRPYKFFCRNRLKHNIYKSIIQTNKVLSREISRKGLKMILATANSYLGSLSKYQSFNLRQIIFNKRLSITFKKIFKHKRGYKKVNLIYLLFSAIFLTLRRFYLIINMVYSY